VELHFRPNDNSEELADRVRLKLKLHDAEACGVLRDFWDGRVRPKLEPQERTTKQYEAALTTDFRLLSSDP
jgi:hypothetical protein